MVAKRSAKLCGLPNSDTQVDLKITEFTGYHPGGCEKIRNSAVANGCFLEGQHFFEERECAQSPFVKSWHFFQNCANDMVYPPRL